MKHPEWFRSSRLCFLDTLFGSFWTEKYPLFVKSTPNPDGAGKVLPADAFDYYIGVTPKHMPNNKTWVLEVDDVYAPLNITKDHWVALWISLPRRHVVIWDSSAVHARDGDIARAVEPIVVMLPHLLHTFSHDAPLEPFTFERFCGGAVPENIKSGDCGVYCLKYMECHALGIPFPPELCDSNIRGIRDKIAAEVFDETKAKGKENRNWDMLDLYESN